MSTTTLLIIVLVVVLVGGFWGYRSYPQYGYGIGGVIGVLIIILLVLLLTGNLKAGEYYGSLSLEAWPTAQAQQGRPALGGSGFLGEYFERREAV